MCEPSQHEITRLLQGWRGGDPAALEKLMPVVYAEMHRLAHIYLSRERPGHTLQTSALVNEAYLRLIDANKVDWRDRIHFFAICSNIIRRVLIEHARQRHARKRGGEGTVRVGFDEAFVPSRQRDADLIAVDEALNLLAQTDPREAKVVELRFFGGLSEEETAVALGISDRTVRREWEHAKAWLIHQLKRGNPV